MDKIWSLKLCFGSLYPTTKGVGHAEAPLQEWKAEGMENLHHMMEDEDLLQMAGDLIQIEEDPLDDQGVLQMTEGDMGHLEKMADHLHMESEILVPGGLLQMIDTEKAPQEREEDLPLMTGTEMVHHLGIEVEVLHLMIGKFKFLFHIIKSKGIWFQCICLDYFNKIWMHYYYRYADIDRNRRRPPDDRLVWNTIILYP